MTCQNCQSTDIVNIQGLNYCINCGQMVNDKTKAKAIAKPKATTAAKASEPVAVQASSVNDLNKKLETTILKHSESLRVSGAPATHGTRMTGKTLDLKPSAKAPQPIAQAAPKSTTRKSENKKTIIASKAKQSPKTVIPATEPESEILNQVQDDKKKPVARDDKQKKALPEPVEPLEIAAPAYTEPGLTYIARTSFRTALSGPFANFGLFAALLLILPLALALSPDNRLIQSVSWQLQPRLMLMIGGIYFLISLLLWAWTKATIIYGAAGQQDARPSRAQDWVNVGRDSLPDLAVLGSKGLVILGVLGYGCWVLADYAAEISPFTWLPWAIQGLGAIVILKLAMLWLLAHYPVVLGGLSTGSALKVAWQLWRKGWRRLWTAGLIAVEISLSWISVVCLSFFGAWWVLQRYQVATDDLVLSAITLLVGTTVLAVLMIFQATYWLQVYRALVKHYLPARSSQLLSGRRPAKHSHGWLAVMASGAVVIGLATWLVP